MKLSNLFKRNKAEPTLDDAMAVMEHVEVEKPSNGRVVRAKHRDYKPFTGSLRGGRVVKTMPREIRKIKEAQEMLPDDSDDM